MKQVEDFLVELGTEELPPKALTKLAQAFHDNLIASLRDNELSFTDSEWFATPRRLAVRVLDLQTQQEDKVVERLGPAVAAAFDDNGQPRPAATGFAKSCGVDVSELEKLDTPKGQRLGYKAKVEGESASKILPEAVKFALSRLPIPKAMRWGNSDAEFIRPPHWLVMLLGDQIVNAELLELKSGNQSFGHRFHAPEAITIPTPSDYEALMLEAKVNPCFEARKAKIRIQVEELAQSVKGTAVIEEDLLEEVASLVEWPVALMGKFDDVFLQVPAEALIATMAADQKYFHLEDEQGNLLPHFITVSNIESSNPTSVIAGNEKVIRPRLADAKFFYDQDRKHSLSSYTEKLKGIVFQNKLGSLFDKTQRVKAVAEWIASQQGSDTTHAARAAELSKCDLLSKMVYEFPELQGIMGRYYAAQDGEHADVAQAMDEIYMPRFAGDKLPETTTGTAVALADRMDTLVGIFGIGQAPTGAKDPFALRRAALGVLRLLVEKHIAIDLAELIEVTMSQMGAIDLVADTQSQLLEFFAARSQAWYADNQISAQVIQSVAALSLSTPLDIDRRIHAVNTFNAMEESEVLAGANKRVSNILAKSDVAVETLKVDPSFFSEDEEKALFDKLNNIDDVVKGHLNNADYEGALVQLASLKNSVDNFFVKVMVNVECEKTRNNRLALLNQLRQQFIAIADISLLQK
ncbi:glycine--tRNA ligase subunit beta [Pleionea sp. CnH1-48]|uniref:glycine--tRNA ligase subunit beta n=1 Tax=Pleionea sp. CnH1-48 TaxID=2954494 RepID=UPI0020985F8B|nr:glycine--tRNA ligase subunit beta [Pleionea sp. CnH1-48]MCO7226661.1 glycine--tRNA ligase subunit beta [Pleionea sp. CnH1-48]